MIGTRVLFISGSIGLGHIQRDLAIASALRQLNPELQIRWIAADPASRVLERAGESLVPAAAAYAANSRAAEAAAHGMELNIWRYLVKSRDDWLHNIEVFRRALAEETFDLVIGDETYEIFIALDLERSQTPTPLVAIYDFVGVEAMTRSPIEHVGMYALNAFWNHMASGPNRLMLFIGELLDIPDRPFGPLLPSRRAYARQHLQPVGYVLPFDPNDYADRVELRSRLGYGPEPLIIGAIGGTAIGRELLELWGQSFPIVAERLPDVRFRLVTGPRLDPTSVRVPPGVEVSGYVPDLFEHLAASDLALVEGGGTVTLELTALRRPFLFFPRDGDFEQEHMVAERVLRHGAGKRVRFIDTTPAAVAGLILAGVCKEADWPRIKTDGATVAARLITERFLTTTETAGQSVVKVARLPAR
jgi:UDP:flavonoid glycosyltransferase YjiC (YdhE family)